MSPSKIKVLLIFSVINSCLANSWKEGTVLCSTTSVRWVCLFDEKHSNYRGRNLLSMLIFIVKSFIRKAYQQTFISLNVSFGTLTNYWIEIILSTDQIRMTVTVASVIQQRK